MIVFAVGSTNPVKVRAAQSIVETAARFSKATIVGVSVDSGVSEQPITQVETFTGAATRAERALDSHPGAQWALGVEDGMFPSPLDATTYLNVCVACVLGPDGARNFGASSSFAYPAGVTRRVLGEGLDVSAALRAEGLTRHENIGADMGAIGLLSKGRLVREDYTRQAVLAALLPWL